MRITKKMRWMAAIMLCALAPSQTFAWNLVGHEVVARIAWEQLTPVARQQIKLIIRQHPAIDADLLKDAPADVGDRDMYAFVVSASWPDIIRAEHNPWHDKDHHPTWHYINIPYILPGTNIANLQGAEPGSMDWKDGTDPTDAVEAMQKCEKDLRDPNLPAADKAVALSWYLHLVGDVHQPLHANTLFSDRFPSGDKGGNGSFVRAPVETTQPSLIPQDNAQPSATGDLLQANGSHTTQPTTMAATMPLTQPINLHAYWDNIFGRFGPPRVVDALQREITDEYPPAALHDQAAVLTYATWIAESNDYAIKDVRRDGKLETAAQNGPADHHIQAPPLPDDYLPRAQELCRLRMATAGYRLANMLNAIFTGPSK